MEGKVALIIGGGEAGVSTRKSLPVQSERDPRE